MPAVIQRELLTDDWNANGLHLWFAVYFHIHCH